jgi:prevent-host-death family protein
MSVATPTWTVADAKARLSEVIDRAQTEGPQRITKNGRPTAMVVSIDEWERKTKRKGTLADFFANSPLRGAQLQIERDKELPRDPDL